jgi:hypothetical protein
MHNMALLLQPITLLQPTALLQVPRLHAIPAAVRAMATAQGPTRAL